jgi:hypothetical protein
MRAPPRPVTPLMEQPVADGMPIGVEQGKQEGVGETGHEQKLTPVFPFPQTGTLHRQLYFAIAPRQFNLSAASIDQNDPPRGLQIGHRLGSHDIPGLVLGAGTRDHQPQRIRNGWVLDGDGDQSDFTLEAAAAFGHQAMSPTAIPTCDLARLAFGSLSIQQFVASRPAYDETRLGRGQLPQPRSPGETAVKDMKDAAPPGLGTAQQPGRFEITL